MVDLHHNKRLLCLYQICHVNGLAAWRLIQNNRVCLYRMFTSSYEETTNELSLGRNHNQCYPTDGVLCDQAVFYKQVPRSKQCSRSLFHWLVPSQKGNELYVFYEWIRVFTESALNSGFLKKKKMLCSLPAAVSHADITQWFLKYLPETKPRDWFQGWHRLEFTFFTLPTMIKCNSFYIRWKRNLHILMCGGGARGEHWLEC